MFHKAFATSLAALALIAAAPAFSAARGDDQQANGSSTSESAKPAKSERKICRRFDNSASRMASEKVCLTKEGWRQFEAAQEH